LTFKPAFDSIGGTMTEAKTENIEHDSEPRMYELGYLFVPTIAEDDLSERVNGLRSMIEKAKGGIVSEGAPNLITLAYKMDYVAQNKKRSFDTAFFGWIKFNATGEGVEKLKDELYKASDIIRFLMIKTEEAEPRKAPRTPSASEVIRSSSAKKKAEKQEEPISEKALDEAIKELVT